VRNPWNTEFRRPSRVPRPRRAARNGVGTLPDRDRIPSAAMALRSGPPPGARIPADGSRRRRHGFRAPHFRPAFELANGARTQVLVLLGEADGATAAADLIRRGRATDHEATLRDVASFWEDAQGTGPGPDTRPLDGYPAQWLASSTRRSRADCGRDGVLPRPAAPTGFRDQLQDVRRPHDFQARSCPEHLLRAAEHQFVEGDVQHCGIRPPGRGVRLGSRTIAVAAYAVRSLHLAHGATRRSSTRQSPTSRRPALRPTRLTLTSSGAFTRPLNSRPGLPSFQSTESRSVQPVLPSQASVDWTMHKTGSAGKRLRERLRQEVRSVWSGRSAGPSR